MGHRVRDVEPVVLRGQQEFAKAFGYSDADAQARLREKGMPCMHDGSLFMYNPARVLAWMEKNWTVKPPDIKRLKENEGVSVQHND